MTDANRSPIQRFARIVEAALRESGRPQASAVLDSGELVIGGVDIEGVSWRDMLQLVNRACELSEQRVGTSVPAVILLETLSPNRPVSVPWPL